MIHFSPITLEDRETIERYTQRSEIRNCDLSFTNIFCWQPIYKSAYAVIGGFLVIRFNIDGGEKMGYMQPIGESGSLEFDEIIPYLAQDAHAHGDRLRIIGINESGCESIRRAYNDEFALFSDPSFEDYIYSREALSSLVGKRLQPKRNHINQFRRLYPSFEYRPLSRENLEECLALDCRWRTQHGEKCDATSNERGAMLRAFTHFDELEISGGVLYVEGRMVAFTYGSPINHDTFAIHVEKGDVEVVGCYSVVNQLFAQSLGSQYLYINREEDLGIEGLRRAKMSYYPIRKERKFTAIYLHHDEKECKQLWRRVFGDEDQFIDEFLHSHYSRSRMLRVCDRDNRYLAMVHIVDFDSAIGRVGYIYGVATHPDFRGQGYATMLMHRAIDMLRAKGCVASMLIPSEEWLVGYYGRFGYIRGCRVRFDAPNNFDFGSGDSERDNALMLPFTHDINLPESLTLSAV